MRVGRNNVLACRPSMNRYKLLAVAIFVVALVTTASETSVANTDAKLPAYAIKVARGKLRPQVTWSIWLFGSQHGSCWTTRVRQGTEIVSNDTACGFSVPRRVWQFAARSSSRNPRHSRSMLFFLTRRDLRLLKVRVEDEGADRWLEMPVKSLSKEQAAGAHLPSNFGYASDTTDGIIGCVKRVVAVGREGQVVQNSRVNLC